MKCLHYILKGADDVELIIDGLYEDKKGRLFQLDKAFDRPGSGGIVQLVEFGTDNRKEILQKDMEAYIRGGALKNTGTCCRCNPAGNPQSILVF